jgi:hypothetical protein
MKMALRGYISNISPLWKIEDQRKMLAAEGVDPDRIFVDELTTIERRAHRVESLSARAEMLRPTTRKSDERIIIASPAVLAWSSEDFTAALTEAAARNATVRFLDTNLEVGPQAKIPQLHKAAKAFAATRKRSGEVEHGRAGGLKSAEVRSKETAAKSIEAEWALSEGEEGYMPTSELLASVTIRNYSTAVRYIGHRPIKQAARQAALKRKASRERQKEGARA